MKERSFEGECGIMLGAVLAATLALGCGATVTAVAEEDLGPIDQLVDEVDAAAWPGDVGHDGVHVVRRINAFFQDAPTAYWFAGFAPRNLADVYWFCREGDSTCPFTEAGVVDRTRTVGDPVFSHIPAQPGYSPFWRVWRVDVGPHYQPNDIKSVAGIDEATAEGRVKLTAHIHNFGEDVGPDIALMHSLVVLTGTQLAYNGEDVINEPGVPTVRVPKQNGWHQQHKLEFFEFSVTDGIFPPSADSESLEPLGRFPFSDLLVFFRDCANGSESITCDFTISAWSAVSELGVEADITGDGDEGDTNNIVSGFPGISNPDSLDLPYSPLRRIMQVRMNREHDEKTKLIDTSVDQNVSNAKAPDTIREWVANSWVQAPEPIYEELDGNIESIIVNLPAIKPDR